MTFKQTHAKKKKNIKAIESTQGLMLTQLMKYAWINLITSNVTSRLMGIKLLKRMMKVRKFRPKFAAPPSDTVRRGRTRKGGKKVQRGKRGSTKRQNQFK